MRHWIRENRWLLIFLLLLGLFRSAIADWNTIPSSSMHPTLLEGDVVLVNRLAYDFKLPLSDRILIPALGEPQHGDIVTFASPADGMRLIKRVIGLPGDVVWMVQRRLVINGKPLAYRTLDETDGTRQLSEALDGRNHRVQWQDGAGMATHFGPVKIPEGQYLVLGDNRDNSADSRFIGFIPRALLIGRAERILASADVLGNWLPRWTRFGQTLYPTAP